MSNEISSFQQSRNKLNMFNLFRLCRKTTEISFDIVAKIGNSVAETGNIVAKNGNNVEATFDFVEKTAFYDKLVRHCCRFLATKSNVASTKSNVASTLLLVWTGLNRAVTAGGIGRRIRGATWKLAITRNDNLHPISATDTPGRKCTKHLRSPMPAASAGYSGRIPDHARPGNEPCKTRIGNKFGISAQRNLIALLF